MPRSLSLLVVLCLTFVWPMASFADERRDPAVFVDEVDAYKAGLEEQADGRPTARVRRTLRLKLDAVDLPKSSDEFRQAWHQPPVCQSLTGQCWAFASTSFLESEVHRISGRKVRLSETWTIYWEFVEKARRFIRHKGDSYFGRGSEPNASFRIWQQYGVVPAEAYRGLLGDKRFLDDRKLCSEMAGYLDSLKAAQDWDEDRAIAKVRDILDRHLGPHPETVDCEKTRMTPHEYFQSIMRFQDSDYVSLLSLMEEPWHRWCTFKTPDNWWKSRQYYNVPAVEFLKAIRETIRSGGTVCLVTDNSEPGFYYYEDVAVVPSFDIPGTYIDDAARQLRFSSQSTTDDHVVHIVGMQQRGDVRWYLVKDSDTKPRNGSQRGYMFYHEDYIRLKALAAVLPRTSVEHALGRSLGLAPGDEASEQARTQPSTRTDQ